MQGSNITVLLSSLSSAEMKRLGEFLNSPFHNKNKRALRLFELLAQHYPEFKDKSLDRKTLYSIVFSDKNPLQYNDSSMRSLVSDLAILCGNFLTVTALLNDESTAEEILLRELSSRKLKTLFMRQLKKAQDSLASDTFKGEEQYLKRFFIEDIKSSEIQYSDDLKIHRSTNLRSASDFLTFYYIIRTIKSLNFISLQKQHNINNDDDLAQNIISSIDAGRFLAGVRKQSLNDFGILKVYFSIYEAMRNPHDERKFIELKQSVKEYEALFSPLEKYGIYASVANCCVQRIDLGIGRYNSECLEVYKLMLAKKLFEVYPGYFSVASFTAIVNAAIASGEYEFAKHFIAEYVSKLNPDSAANVERFSLAQLSFAEKDYVRTLDLLSRTDTEFANFKYHIKTLTIKACYEMNDFDSLFYYTDTFAHFLRNNKHVSPQFRENYLNFIRVVENLVRHNLKGIKSSLERAEEVIHEGNTASASWLFQKLKENR